MAQVCITVTPLREKTDLSSVIEKFRTRYGDSGMKYYSKLDVAQCANSMDNRYDLLDTALRSARRYLSGLGARSVAPSANAVEALSALHESLPELSSDPAETFALLDRLVSPATIGSAGPRFFGFVIGGSLPVTLAANWLAGAWDQNAALNESTPGVARLEEVALRWLIELFELPAYDCRWAS